MANEETRRAAIAELARRELARRESVKQPEPTTPEVGMGDYLKRQAGLTARAALEGANDVVSPFTNAAAWLMNQPLKAVGADYRFPEQNWAASNLLSQVGLPEPQTGAEKAGNIGGRLVASIGFGSPVGRVVSESLGVAQPLSKLKPGKAPSVEQLRQASQNAYNAADRAGVVIAEKSFRGMVSDIEQGLKKQGLNGTLHPRVTAALKEMTESSGNVSFQDAEILRKIMKNAASSSDKSERRLAQIAISKLDDFIGGMKPSDVVSGNPRIASSMIYRARDAWSKASKGEEIQNMLDKAKTNAPNFSASGLENALRTQFRQLANNPARMRMFSKAEQAAIKKVAEGGPIENGLRMVGKFAPTGVVSSGLSAGTGFVLGGPLGAVGLPAIGGAARLGATSRTLGSARAVSEMVRGGPGAPQMLPTSAVMRALIYGTPPVTGSAIGKVPGYPPIEIAEDE